MSKTKLFIFLTHTYCFQISPPPPSLLLTLPYLGKCQVHTHFYCLISGLSHLMSWWKDMVILDLFSLHWWKMKQKNRTQTDRQAVTFDLQWAPSCFITCQTSSLSHHNLGWQVTWMISSCNWSFPMTHLTGPEILTWDKIPAACSLAISQNQTL